MYQDWSPRRNQSPGSRDPSRRTEQAIARTCLSVPSTDSGTCGCWSLSRSLGRRCRVLPRQTLRPGRSHSSSGTLCNDAAPGSIAVYGIVANSQIPPVALFTNAVWSSRARSGSTAKPSPSETAAARATPEGVTERCGSDPVGESARPGCGELRASWGIQPICFFTEPRRAGGCGLTVLDDPHPSAPGRLRLPFALSRPPRPAQMVPVSQSLVGVMTSRRGAMNG
jgi:hypothetical protein